MALRMRSGVVGRLDVGRHVQLVFQRQGAQRFLQFGHPAVGFAGGDVARDQHVLVELVADLPHQRLDLLEVQDQAVLVQRRLHADVHLVVVSVQSLGRAVREDQEVRGTELQVVLVDLDRPALSEAAHARVVDRRRPGDLGHGWTFERLNRAFILLMQAPAPALVALGMTRYWRSEQGLQLDAGPFVKALEYATGLDAVVMGKPARAFFDSAASLLGIIPSELLMIGDDIQGDIAAAQASGMRAALVRTGKFSETDLQQEIIPDVLFDSIANLGAWWEQQE